MGAEEDLSCRDYHYRFCYGVIAQRVTPRRTRSDQLLNDVTSATLIFWRLLIAALFGRSERSSRLVRMTVVDVPTVTFPS